MTRVTWRRRFSRDEQGIALIMVIGIGAVLMVLVATALAYSVGGMQKARTDQSWDDAMAAAYAGVEEYESRLANDNTYQQYGNSLSSFSSTSQVTLPTGTAANPAFGVGSTGSWADVPDSNAATFRYEVDNSKYASTGVLRLRSTGRVGSVTRTVVVNLKQQGFIDFLYFTNYEIQDPALSGADVTTCTKYYWAGRPSGCSEIAFDSGDVVNGPVHSNDAIRICSAQFKQSVTTSYNPTSGKRYVAKDSTGTACSGQVFDDPLSPSYSPVVGMPPTNSALKNEVRSDLPVDVPRPGCLYTGPTTIKYNSDGTMTVRSPWTKFTNVSGAGSTGGTNPPQCGVLGTATGQLGSTTGATIPVVPQNLIFVQNVPATSTDKNYWASNQFPSGINCSLSGSTVACKGASSQSNGNGIGYPMANEKAPSTSSYDYRSGDAFIQGQLKGQETVAADNYIYVTGDLTYTDSNSDILGLVGNNAIFVYNPMDSTNNALLTGTNRVIDAALLSVAHTVQVQNYDKGGSRGTLTVMGAIAQKYRGIVRSGSNGYTKNYVYDPRFRYIAPPKFLSPVSTTYGVSVLVEVKSAFTWEGVAQ